MLTHNFKYFGYNVELEARHNEYAGKHWYIVFSKKQGERILEYSYYIRSGQPLALWQRVIKMLKHEMAEGLKNDRL